MTLPYWDIVRALPLPSLEQTERFVHYVANAHSWYKHLPPVPPGTPFLFYLDPHAGMSAVGSGLGRPTGFRDRLEGESHIHYSWMPTARYRALYGHWAYAVHRTGTPLDMTVMSDGGEWVQVPAELLRASIVPLTGFVHGRGLSAIDIGMGRFHEHISAFTRDAGRMARTAEGRRYLSMVPGADDVRDRLGIAAEEDVAGFAERERRIQQSALHGALLAARTFMQMEGCGEREGAGGDDALVAEVLRDPASDDCRLVYADSLEAAGHPEGSLIQLMCAAAKMDADDPERPRLEVGIARTIRKLAGFAADLHELRAVAYVGWVVRRGFVESVKASAEDLVRAVAPRLSRHPVRELVLSGLRSELVAALAKLDVFERVESLELLDAPVEAAISLLASPSLRKLSRLSLRLSVEGAARLAELEVYRRITALDVAVIDHVDAVAAALLSPEPPRGLASLRIHALKGAQSASFEAFDRLARAPSLSSLDIGAVEDERAVGAIARLSGLRMLAIEKASPAARAALYSGALPLALEDLRAPARASDVRALAGSRTSPLRTLELRPPSDGLADLEDPAHGALDDDAIEVLAASPVGSGLRSLTMRPTRRCDLSKLGAMPLRRLALPGTPTSPVVARGLARWTMASKLTSLGITGGGDLESALAALFDGEAFVPLRRLSLLSSGEWSAPLARGLTRAGPTLALSHLSLPSISSEALATLAYSTRLAELEIVEAKQSGAISSRALRERFTLVDEWRGAEWVSP